MELGAPGWLAICTRDLKSNNAGLIQGWRLALDTRLGLNAVRSLRSKEVVPVLELVEVVDFGWLFLVAAVLGGVGGLVFELLQRRYGQTGLVEMPGRGRGRYRDWGVWANILIGAVAAVAALWAFPPQTETVVAEGGGTTSTSQYSIIDLVGLSLIIGSAGSSFLSSLQAKALARLKGQEAALTREVAKSQLQTIGSQVEELKEREANLTGEAAKTEFKSIEGQLRAAEAALVATAAPGTHELG